MKIVNLGKPLSCRLNLRLTEEQFNFLCYISNCNSCSPSEFVRRTIESAMTNCNDFELKEVVCLENNKADKYNIVQ